MTRVLVVDDSPTFRALLKLQLEKSHALEVVGEAASADEAVDRARTLKPDVITMDVMIPGGSGLVAAERIMRLAPAPIVVVSAAVDPKSQELSLEALRTGAVAVQAKPQGDRAWAELRQLVQTMSEVKVIGHRQSGPKQALEVTRAPVRLVAIGASTGGPPVVEQLLAALPRDCGFPVVIAQHLAPGFVEGFARWLSRRSPLPVRVATSPVPLGAPVVVLPPDAHHLVVEGEFARGLPAAEGTLAPSADRLFHSLAHGHPHQVCAVLLTGMGEDGAEGLARLRALDAWTIAQDEASSMVFGMPAAAAARGAARELLPPELIARRLQQLSGGRR
jgi:two-component system chemotaxis response regulator CheB